MKVCSKCKAKKELTEFNKDKSRNDGLQNYCKWCKKQYDNQYYLGHKTKLNQRRTQHDKIRIQTDIDYKLIRCSRIRLYQAIKNDQKAGSAVRDLGCTIQELKIYLESKFQEGMSWSNWSNTGWHIDHIIPLSSFDLTNRDEFLKACHYTNLQPLWAKDNLSKNKMY